MERIRNKVFTLDEANALLPELERALESLTALGHEITTLRREMQVLSAIESSGASWSSPDVQVLRQRERDVADRIDRFRRTLAETQGLGCIIRDLELGLVDFYTMAGGRIVCLCWRRGEPRIEHWHPVDEGFSGRRPLEDLA